MKEIKYYRFLDEDNHNFVLKAESDDNWKSRKQFMYNYGTSQWYQTERLIAYEWPDSDLWDMKEEISSDSAEQLILQVTEEFRLMYKKAIVLARTKHMGQVDKGGHSYIEHLENVAKAVEGYELKTIAILHDIVEDTDMTFEQLRELGFRSCVVDTLEILTRESGVEYKDYIEKVKSNSKARKVKIADLKDNIRIERIPKPTKKDYRRIEKYKVALEFLENV